MPDMKMQPDELQTLHTQADEIQQTDNKLGQILHALVHHLGHAHGLDATEIDKQAQAQDASAQTPKSKGASNGN